MTDIRCGTCKFWLAKQDKNGRRIVKLGYFHPCTAPFPIPIAKFPSSMTINASRKFMEGAGGKDCPAWESFK